MISKHFLLISCYEIAFVSGKTRNVVFLPDENVALKNPLLLSVIESLGLQYLMLNQSQMSRSTSHWIFKSEHFKTLRFVWTETDSVHPNSYRTISKTSPIQLNQIPGFDVLTNDDKFAHHLKRMRRHYGEARFRYVPHYFLLPRDIKHYTATHTKIKKLVQYDEKLTSDPHSYQRFIARMLAVNVSEAPKAHSNRILSNLTEVKQLLAQHENGIVEVRQYIEPFLLAGHKFNFGVYVAVLSISPLRIYSYRSRLIKIAYKKYPKVMQSKTTPLAYTFDTYIAPWEFPPLMKHFVEFPSPNSEGSDAWEIVKNYMRSYGLDVNQMEEEVTDAIVTTVLSVRKHWEKEIQNIVGDTSHSNKFVQLFKFDFEIDDIGRPWLIQVHSVPNLKPVQSVLSTDEAFRKDILLDFLKLVNVAGHPDTIHGASKGNVGHYCAEMCGEKHFWDRKCWECPNVPKKSEALFNFSQEYTRRGKFDLLFPSLEKKYDWIESGMSYDVTRNDFRLLFDASIVLTNSNEGSLSSTFCTYRSHCSGHGDCVNGKCVCDEGYEGRTCYILKDFGMERMRIAEKSF
uniref:Tubulin--tyrosine ligase-like protein 5 n=1 Tax=Albugo laibachii Nc14 TaxID=890382 RepID=F0WX47_9STRA|nr:conserved hypothetical protein [Albugo laibachii Nc14]|eukprot:CCA26037.1 conserved hypothetical protein [Albugo laibachii Nc14]